MSLPLVSAPASDARRVQPDSVSPVRALVPLSDAPWRGVEWTPIYIAFLWYIAAISTYRVPGGDVAMAGALLGLLIQRAPLRLPPILGWLGAFIAWAAVAYPLTRFPEQVQETVTLLAKIWLIVLVGANAMRTRQQVRLFVIFFLGCFALYPLRGALVNYYFAGYALFGRALWNFIYANPNDLAAFALLQLSMAMGLLVSERRMSWLWMAALAGVGLLPLLVLLTQSRGGIIALGVFTTLVIASRRRRPTALLATAALAIGLALVAPSGVWSRMSGLSKATNVSDLTAVDPEGSARARFATWRVAVKIIGEQPLVGVGLGAYPLAHASYALDEEFDRSVTGQRDTHSTPLNVLAETGVPGLLFFLGLVISTFLNAERIRRASLATLPGPSSQLLYLEFGLAAFLVAGIFASFAHLSLLYIHLVLIWALAEAHRRAAAAAARSASVGTSAHGPVWSYR